MNTRPIVLGMLPVFLLAAGSAQERFRKTPPIPEPPTAIRLPAIETHVLDNGLRLAVVERPGSPLMCLELSVAAGEDVSPQDLPGLATFTARMMNRGTEYVSASDLEERVDAIGGSFSTTVTVDVARLSLTFLSEYLDQALELLGLMILEPAFSEREIVALKRSSYYELLGRQADPEFVGYRQLLRILFHGHPWANALYNEDVFRNFSRRDVEEFYVRYYRPNNAVLVLAGNITLSAATKKVSHFLNLWTKKDVDRHPLPPPSASAERRFCLVEFPRAKDAHLFIGNMIFPGSDSEVCSFSVLNQILGGTPNSRLLLNLREEKEIAYYAFSRLELLRHAGIYSVQAKVIPEGCFASIREILRELERLGREKTSAFEVEQAKQFLIGRFPLELSRLESLTQRVSEIVSFGLGSSRWTGYFDEVMGVDADRVFEVAQKFLSVPPVVVIVGDPERLLEHLRELDSLDVYDAKGVLRFTLKKGDRP